MTDAGTAEALSLRHYEQREHRQSEIDPHATITVCTGLLCPACLTRMDMIEHGDTKECPRCELRMTVHGSTLKCLTYRTLSELMQIRDAVSCELRSLLAEGAKS